MLKNNKKMSSCNFRQRIQGRRTRRRRYQKIYIENHKLKEKLKAQTKTSDKYRKRYERLLCSVDSPRKRTKRMLGTSPVSNDVRRTLVYHHALVKSLKQKFQCAAKEKTRNLVSGNRIWKNIEKIQVPENHS